MSAGRLLAKGRQGVGDGDHAGVLVPLVHDGNQLDFIFYGQLHYAVEVLVGAHVGFGIAQG